MLVRKWITIANKASKLLESIQVVEAPQKSLLELLSAKNRIAKGLKVRTISIPHTFCKPEPGERGGGAQFLTCRQINVCICDPINLIHMLKEIHHYTPMWEEEK